MGLRVLIADQERTFADALAARLHADGDTAVVVPIGGESPARLAAAAQEADIVLLDGDLPGAASPALCRQLAGASAAPNVIMMSYSSEAERVVAAARAGAAAWVTKDESLEHLLRLIHGITRGEIWLRPAVTGRVLRLLLRERQQQQETGSLLATLTPREREVLACLADGAGRQEVAARLSLSANTVRTHLQNLMAKLQVHSTLEAVAMARSSAAQPGRYFYPAPGGQAAMTETNWGVRVGQILFPDPGGTDGTGPYRSAADSERNTRPDSRTPAAGRAAAEPGEGNDDRIDADG